MSQTVAFKLSFLISLGIFGLIFGGLTFYIYIKSKRVLWQEAFICALLAFLIAWTFMPMLNPRPKNYPYNRPS